MPAQFTLGGGLVIDDLYGSQGYSINAFSGDTTYGYNTNIKGSSTE